MARAGSSLLVPLYRLLSIAPGKRLLVALGCLVGLTLIGTAGYMGIEGMGLLDAVFMTVITLSTVGYGEVVPLGTAGKLFSIVLITSGLGTVLYSLGAMAEFLLEGRLGGVLWRRSMMKSISVLREHVIVCGHGRLGRVVTDELRKSGVEVVVVDPRPELEAELVEAGVYHVIGSALEESVLESAGIARARAIVVTTPEDADTVFITMSARSLNASIAIHARAETDTGGRRLRMVGADQIISPYQLGGQRMANAIVRPEVVDFIELSVPGAGAEIDLEQVVIGADSRLDGCRVDEIANHVDLSVVALRRGAEPLRLRLDRHEMLRAGDRVVVVGEPEQMRRLSTLAKAGSEFP
ncbi:MAG: potassium channel protein [Myxococcales bacterium]|nr:potassium channel protein [Myxococcales bacterium]